MKFVAVIVPVPVGASEAPVGTVEAPGPRVIGPGKVSGLAILTTGAVVPVTVIWFVVPETLVTVPPAVELIVQLIELELLHVPLIVMFVPAMIVAFVIVPTLPPPVVLLIFTVAVPLV